MQRRYRADLARAGVKREPTPAGLDDTVFAVEQRLRRRIAETDQDVGIGEFDLAQRERQTGRRLLRGRRAIARRTAGLRYPRRVRAPRPRTSRGLSDCRRRTRVGSPWSATRSLRSTRGLHAAPRAWRRFSPPRAPP